MGLSHQKQLYPMAGIHVFAMESLPYFYEQAWDLWYKEQTACVLLLNFRTFMETPFALNSLPLRQRARCQKLFLFPQSVAKQKKKAELFCKERLWKDISRSDGKDSTRSTRKKGRSGTDHQRVWDTAEDKPAYPGRSFV